MSAHHIPFALPMRPPFVCLMDQFRVFAIFVESSYYNYYYYYYLHFFSWRRKDKRFIPLFSIDEIGCPAVFCLYLFLYLFNMPRTSL